MLGISLKRLHWISTSTKEKNWSSHVWWGFPMWWVSKVMKCSFFLL